MHFFAFSRSSPIPQAAANENVNIPINGSEALSSSGAISSHPRTVMTATAVEIREKTIVSHSRHRIRTNAFYTLLIFLSSVSYNSHLKPSEGSVTSDSIRMRTKLAVIFQQVVHPVPDRGSHRYVRQAV